eukprot:Skav233814  [mRNA]  locus=scaffold658:273381:274946:- [translate_table: standard]
MNFQRAFLDEEGVCPLSRISSESMFDWYLASTTSESVTLLLLLQLVAVLCFMIGFWTRAASFTCWLFALSQHHRFSNCVDYGGDRLRSHLLFWALFQPLGQAWSVDAYLQCGKRAEVCHSCDLQPLASCLPGPSAGKAKEEKDKGLRSTAAPGCAFLILLQMAAMYEYTAATKVGPLWSNGSAVLQTLQLTQFARQPVAGILAMFPSMCRLFTHATLYVEKYGWLLAFLPFQVSRAIAFGMFFALHFGLHLSLRVGCFQLFVLSGWCVALPRFFLDSVEATLHHRWCRSSQLLVVQSNAAAMETSAAKRAIGRASSMGLTFLGYSLMYMAITEGCIHRQDQCSMAQVVRDFGRDSLLTKLGLLQRYNMFSPDPPVKTLRVQVYGILSSPKCLAGGKDYWTHCQVQVVELWGNRGFPSVPTQLGSHLPTWSNLSAPVPQMVDFATNRWRKLVEMKDKAKGVGGYMCAQWQGLQATPDLLGLWFVRITAKPNENETYTGEYRHWCTAHNKKLMLELPRQPWVE